MGLLCMLVDCLQEETQAASMSSTQQLFAWPPIRQDLFHMLGKFLARLYLSFAGPLIFNMLLLISVVVPRWFYATGDQTSMHFRRRLRLLLIFAPMIDVVMTAAVKLCTALTPKESIIYASAAIIFCQGIIVAIPLLHASAEWIMARANAIDRWAGVQFGPTPDAATIHERVMSEIDRRMDDVLEGIVEAALAQIVQGGQQEQQPPPPPYDQ